MPLPLFIGALAAIAAVGGVGLPPDYFRVVVKIHRGDCGGVIDVIAVWIAAFGLPAAGIADTGVGLAVCLYKERQPGKQCFDACVE